MARLQNVGRGPVSALSVNSPLPPRFLRLLAQQRVDGIMEEYTKKFMLDYNMPSFAVGEVRPIRGPGRREIGHFQIGRDDQVALGIADRRLNDALRFRVGRLAEVRAKPLVSWVRSGETSP